MAGNLTWDPEALLRQVEAMAESGFSRREVERELGFTNAATLNSRLVRASQETGKPVPVFRRGSRADQQQRVEEVVVRRRGKGGAFGVNVPQEPLERLGVREGDRLRIIVGRGRISLVSAGESRDVGPRPPRLVKRDRDAGNEAAS